MTDLEWSKLSYDLLNNPTRQQALLVLEARRDLARELVLAINAMARVGAEASFILQEIIKVCEAELLRANAP